MKPEQLKADYAGVAYKFKDADGKWTPLLAFVKEKNGHYYFKLYDDNVSTMDVHVLSIYIAGPQDVENGKEFQLCKFYGTWEKSPHVCGKDCPL